MGRRRLGPSAMALVILLSPLAGPAGASTDYTEVMLRQPTQPGAAPVPYALCTPITENGQPVCLAYPTGGSDGLAVGITHQTGAQVTPPTASEGSRDTGVGCDPADPSRTWRELTINIRAAGSLGTVGVGVALIRIKPNGAREATALTMPVASQGSSGADREVVVHTGLVSCPS